jgi:hypothetical protein
MAPLGPVPGVFEFFRDMMMMMVVLTMMSFD